MGHGMLLGAADEDADQASRHTVFGVQSAFSAVPRRLTGAMRSTTRRCLAAGGVAGPVAFIAAWSILGTGRPGYSPVEDPISRLAAVDASSRVPMTAGFVAFAVGVGLYATALGTRLPGGAAAAAATTAAATLGVASFPLGSALGDGPHAAAAGVAYTALAAMPLLGGRALMRDGKRSAALSSVAIGLASGAALLASVMAPDRTGLLQRAGLTLGDVWIVATAASMMGPDEQRRRPARPNRQ